MSTAWKQHSAGLEGAGAFSSLMIWVAISSYNFFLYNYAKKGKGFDGNRADSFTALFDITCLPYKKSHNLLQIFLQISSI